MTIRPLPLVFALGVFAGCGMGGEGGDGPQTEPGEAVAGAAAPAPTLQDEGAPAVDKPAARAAVAAPIGCGDPIDFLRKEQAAVLARYGALTTQAEIAGYGFLPAHVTTVSLPMKIGVVTVDRPFVVNKIFTGMGATFARLQGALSSEAPQPGDPGVLFFLPSDTVDGREDLAHPSATYRLAGWGYSANVGRKPADASRPPSVGCFPLQEWFFHERGVHTLDGGFSPGIVSAAGLPHARLWDLHVWPDLKTKVPTLGIMNAAGPHDAYDAPAGSFFYPPMPRP